ncbi:hypothetical protein BBJ28_00022862 [Nothophytophthora sp. Chile5]|nr:hypothetical protein BBJ28_00022862 [Nothophytophthora sp. Chile5]
MNSLGLEYGSSSSDDEVVSVAMQITSRPAPPHSPVGEAPTEAAATSDSDVSVGPELKASHQDETLAPAVACVAGPAAPETHVDEDGEAMLLHAGIPPAPARRAIVGADGDPVQERIARFLRVQGESGHDFQTSLQTKKEVRNPYILEKVVEYFGIDELQSNFPRDVFDPRGLPLHEYADALALEQKKRADARTLRQQSGSDSRQLQFVGAFPPSTTGN